jgi:hypothetical protein
MRWYRYHQRVMGTLALFALGFQLAASFAHVHLDGVRQPSGVGFKYSLGRTIAGQCARFTW